MSQDVSHQLPGNIPDGVIRNQRLNLGNLPQKIVANELFECSLTGEASKLYGKLGPNLISCKLDGVTFPFGVSHFDAKDTLFLESEIRNTFDRIMIAQCAFRNTIFSSSTFNDTVFIDSMFEEVTFVDCNFSVATFKSNVFRGCSFLHCETSNKLFEHCLFFHCRFENIALQEGSIVQNFGIQLSDTVNLSIYRAETGQALLVHDIEPRNRLERISLAHFHGSDLNESQDLLATVQFNLDDMTRTNILHQVTGIRQLTSFLLFLYSENRILLLFPLQLFWSIDQMLTTRDRDQLPFNVLDSLEVSSARLRRLHDDLCLSIPPSNTSYLLIQAGHTEEELQGVLQDLQLDVHIQNFQLFNSPSVAEIVSPDAFEVFLFVATVLSTRFRAEVDRYHAERKLLDIGTRLISDGNNNRAAAYQALVALNVPKFIYIRLSARINISILGRLRRMLLDVLEDRPQQYRSDPGMHNTGSAPSTVTILFLAANANLESQRLRLDQEVKEIDEALRASGIRERFRLEQSWVVGERELQDNLLRYKPDVVHLSAHGTSSGKLLLEGASVRRDLVQAAPAHKESSDAESIRGLAEVFAVAGQGIRCVVLNACHSAILAEAVSAHVDCVIGMSESISDEAAIRFSWSFYNSLSYGESVRSSFDLAIAQLALAGYGESQIPTLFHGRMDPKAVTLTRPQGRNLRLSS